MEGVDVFLITGENKNKVFANVAVVEQIENNVRCVTPQGSEAVFKDTSIVAIDLPKKEIVLQKW